MTADHDFFVNPPLSSSRLPRFLKPQLEQDVTKTENNVHVYVGTGYRKSSHNMIFISEKFCVKLISC